jgi:hypothetical protein
MPIWHCWEPHSLLLLLLQAVPLGHVEPHDPHVRGMVVFAVIVWARLCMPLAKAHDVSIAVGALTVRVSCVPPATFEGNAVVPFVRDERLLVPSDTATVPEGRPETFTDTVQVDPPPELPEELPDVLLPELPEELPDVLLPELPEELPEELADVPLPELPEELPDVPLPELPELDPELLALPPPSPPASAPEARGL